MKKYFLCVLFFLVGATPAQELSWNKFTFGGVAQYVQPTGDLGEYWGNALSVGIAVNFKLTNTFSYEMWATYGKFTPEENINKDLPEFDIISIPFGIRYKHAISENTYLTVFSGLENNMFDFDDSDERDENLNESEMGFFACGGIRLRLMPGACAEIFVKYQVIFSAPENMELFNVGLMLVLE